MNIMSRWFKNWKLIINDILVGIGFFWLFVELISYFFSTTSDQIKNGSFFCYLLGASVTYGIFKNYPKSFFISRIRNKDVKIGIKIGDAFEENGSLIVPINDHFDVSLGGNVLKAKSIQCKLIDDYYFSNEEHLKNDICNKIDLQKIPYSSGTVVEIEQNKRKFYLLVNSKRNENNRPSSTIDDFMMALNGMWDYLAMDAARDENIIIPLINTQHGRNSSLTRDTVVKQIIDTFIDASKHSTICEKLIICIHPSDIEKGQLDLDALNAYLMFKCENYKDIQFNPKVEGTEVSSSEIKVPV